MQPQRQGDKQHSLIVLAQQAMPGTLWNMQETTFSVLAIGDINKVQSATEHRARYRGELLKTAPRLGVRQTLVSGGKGKKRTHDKPNRWQSAKKANGNPEDNQSCMQGSDSESDQRSAASL